MSSSAFVRPMGEDDEQRYITGLIRAVGELSQQLGAVRADVKEDVAQLLAGYREDVHRTTIAIHARLLSYEDELLRDRRVRKRRQDVLDDELAGLHADIRQLRWLAASVVLLLSVGVVAYLFRL